MKYRKVKSMHDQFSELGLGCWAFSGEAVWDGYDEKASIAAIHEALELGINVFDVAPIYGFGHAETELGRALRGKSRDSVFIATKCGLVWDESFRSRNDLSAKSIFKEIDESLYRLQTDYIDLYQIHWPDPYTPIEESMEVLTRLQDQGKIRYIGASNFSVPQSLEAMKYGSLVSQQNLYNMIERNASSYHSIELTYRTEDEILPFCHQYGQAFLPYSPLLQGMLSGTFEQKGNFSGRDVRSNNPKLLGKHFNDYYELVEKLKRYCADSIGRPLNEVAINWLLYRSEVTSVICGVQNPEQVLANVKALEWTLTNEQYIGLNRIVEESGLFV